MFGRAILVISSILILGGCAQVGAKAIVEGTYLINAASEYVHENHTLRRWIRVKCFELMRQKIKKLDREGDMDGVNELLVASYPPVVTLEMIKSYKNDLLSLSPIPFGCYANRDKPVEN